MSSKTTSQSIAWIVWSIVSLFYAYQYILRVMPNIMIGNIMEDFQINTQAFGQFSGIYYIGYSLLHIPLGIFFDRYGPRRAIAVCIFLTVIGTMPLVFSDYWAYPVIGRFFVGIGSSGAILGVFKITRMMFREERFARMLSLSVTVGLIGAIYGGGPVSYMCGIYGHKAVVCSFAVMGLLLASCTYWMVPDQKIESNSIARQDIKEVLTNKRVLLSCFGAGLMVGPLEGFADVWATTFLKKIYGFEETVAASLPSMIYIGMCFGGPLLSIIAEKIGNYLITIIASSLVMGSFFSCLLFFHMSSVVLSVGFILVGICCAYQILAIYQASTYVREGIAGLSTAVANMIIMFFGYAFHSIIGTIVNAFGGPQEQSALQYGMMPIPILLFSGGYLFFILLRKEQQSIHTRQEG